MTVTVEDDGPNVRARVQLAACSAERALEAFTRPDLLAGWWGNAELTADLVKGGRYEVWFAGIPARMTGKVITYKPGTVLEISWAWDNLPDAPPTTVVVMATATGDCATLTIEHGPHADDDAGRGTRKDHREGWAHFLPRLQALLAGGQGSAAG
jgi:uncharacterized protein YndB with AHSA1/START domain